MTQKLTIQLTDSDYWDADKNQFVIYYNGLGAIIPTVAVVIDSDGVSWNCFLSGVKYYKKQDLYEVNYKTF